MSDVTVVIPNWNGMKYLPDCLASLAGQTYPGLKVILIDNGSEDGSAAYARETYPGIRIRAFRRNTGFCRAVNEGIRLSDTPYVILLNNDTVCDPDFVSRMVEGIRRHPKAFSCSARMMQMNQPDKIDDAGDYYCALGWAFADAKGLNAEARQKEHKVFSACAGAAVYRRELFKQIGYFDEKHFAYLEDVDIGYRAQRKGYENWYLPDAVVYHAGSSASGSIYNEFKTIHTSRNSVYLILKNMPLWQIFLNLPFLTAGFLVKTVFFIRKGYGKTYLKGLAKGYRMGAAARKNGRNPKKGEHYFSLQIQLWKNMILRFRQH